MGRIALCCIVVGLLVAALLPVTTLGASQSEPAAAATASDFDPGNIISDAVFYDWGSMSAPDIQSFLANQESKCAAGATCLKDYTQATPAKSATVEGCSAFSAQSLLSAAQIIQMVAQSCGINPRVIITTLEKEEGLVTSTAPSAAAYRIAMGYGCPDTAACDTTYYGFFNQVYSASRQFKYYQYKPSAFTYRAGQTNTIQWSPNASCGSSQVYITNQATAGLYNYTPYRPNAAAMANLYGVGDGCSSYGNRNFWRIFTDWFGSTTISSSLVRSTDSLQIWLVSNGTKYPINNPDTYFTYASALGTVATVTSSYLASLPSGAELGRFIGDTAGNLYFVDSGKRYHFDSYERVADYGYPSASWIPVADSIINSLQDGGQLTNAVNDSAGNFWSVSDGTRSQAVDDVALQQSGETENLTQLSTAALGGLTFAAPILRDDIVIQQAGTQSYWLNSASTVSPLPADIFTSTPLSTSVPTLTLTSDSTALLPVNRTFSGEISSSTGSDYLVTTTGKVAVGSSTDLGLTKTTVGNAILAALPTQSGTLSVPVFLRGASTPTVYAISGGQRHSILAWSDYVWLAASASNGTTYVTPQSEVNSIALGSDYVRPGSIVKSASAPNAYVVDGSANLIYIGNYNTTLQLGLGSQARVVSDLTISATPKSSGAISRLVSCNGQLYLGVDGVLRPTSSALASAYGFSAPTVLDASTCSSLTISSVPLSAYVRDSTGAVFTVIAGQRRWVPNYTVLTSLAGSSPAITDMSDSSINDIQMGLPLESGDVSVSPNFIRADGTATVYYVRSSILSALPSWSDYLYASRSVSDTTTEVIPASVLRQLSIGLTYTHPGMLVRVNGSPTVSMIDGTSSLIYVNNFGTTTSMGALDVASVSQSDLAAYTSSGTTLTPVIQCGSQSFIGLGGLLYPLTGGSASQYGNQPETKLQSSTCAALPQSATSPGKFISGPDGSVYMMEAGVRHHVRSPAGFAQLGGNWSTVIAVSAYTVSQFPVGSEVG